MPLIFTTDPDSPYDVEIQNVGVLAGNARGGIPIDYAAETLRELQDDDGKPLTGKRLADAARDFADDRGLRTKEIKNLDEKTRERLRVEAGAFPAGRSIEEISREAAERDLGQIEEASDADAVTSVEEAVSAGSAPATKED